MSYVYIDTLLDFAFVLFYYICNAKNKQYLTKHYLES